MINSHIELLVIAGSRSRCNPVIVERTILYVRLREQIQHLLSHGIDQVAWPSGRLKLRGKIRTAWAVINVDSVVGDERATNRTAVAGVIDTRIGIIKLSGDQRVARAVGTHAGGIERSAL